MTSTTSAPRPDPSRPGPGGAAILIVEDEPELVRALRINLRARQYDVRTAGTGREALAAAASHPPDAVTASGSGLDPGISPENAAIQVNRVAEARNLPVSKVKELVAKYTQGRTLGFLGEPAVNVLELNIALDQLSAKSSG